MNFELTILGNSSASPTLYRHPSSQVLRYNESLYLIDCGEGTQQRLLETRQKYHKINQIFISHLHGDHYLGLIGLISTLHLQGRTAPLDIFGPEPLRRIIDTQFEASAMELRYPLNFHITNPDAQEKIYEDNNIAVWSFPLKHRIPCTGFRFEEQERPKNLNREKLKQYSIPRWAYGILKKGLDLILENGQLYKNDELTLPSENPRTYAYCSDTIYDPSIIPYIKEVDLLYHESTFLHDMIDRATETFHTTSLQAAMIAEQANVVKLLLGHYSARYWDLNDLLKEAQSHFAYSHLSIEGETYKVRG